MSQPQLSVLSLLTCKLSRVTEVATDARSYVVSERHLAKNTGSVVLIIPVGRLWYTCALASAFGELYPCIGEHRVGERAGQRSWWPPLPFLSCYSCPFIQSRCLYAASFFFFSCLKTDERVGTSIFLEQGKNKPLQQLNHKKPQTNRVSIVRRLQRWLWSPRAIWWQATPFGRVCVSVKYKSLLLTSP